MHEASRRAVEDRARVALGSQFSPFRGGLSCAASLAVWQVSLMPDIPTGAVVSAAAKAVSSKKPWTMVKRHDRLLRHEYEDLMTFARDELQTEARALEDVKNDLAARGILQSGAFGAGLLRVREESARRWRDHKLASDRRIEELNEAEGFTVRAWRKLRRKPWPENPKADEL